MINLLGFKFNNLEVLEYIGKSKNDRHLWSIKCHCGKLFKGSQSRIVGKIIESCGCIKLFKKKNIYNGGRSNKGSLYWAKDKINYSILSSKKYGHVAVSMSPEDLVDFYKQHNHCCDICNVPEAECSRGLALDHDHQTGAFRGLICNNCNRGLGLLGDNISSISKVVDYLENYHARNGVILDRVNQSNCN